MQKNFAKIFPFLPFWTFPTLEILEMGEVESGSLKMI
jgi:hypothetical protein